MTLPFTGFKDFLQWLKTVLIMIPVTIFVLVVGLIFYLTVKHPDELEESGGGGGYCDHFDDLIGREQEKNGEP